MRAYRLAALFLCVGLMLAFGGCTRGEENPPQSIAPAGSGEEEDIPPGEEEGERPPGSGEGDPEEEDMLEEAVVRTVLEQEEGRFLPGEFQGAGCKIFAALPDGEDLAVFALIEYREYSFINDVFTNVSGCRARVRIDFGREDGAYAAQRYVHLEIDTLPEEEIEELMAPLKEAGADTVYSDTDLTELRAQVNGAAEEYLRRLGRDASVAERETLDLEWLYDKGISDSAMSRILEDEKASSYPDWLGTEERLENGERFVCRTDYEEQTHLITYTKTRYDSGEVVEILRFDALTGERNNS